MDTSKVTVWAMSGKRIGIQADDGAEITGVFLTLEQATKLAAALYRMTDQMRGGVASDEIKGASIDASDGIV